MRVIKLLQSVMAFVLISAASNTNATPVSVTADFTTFTVDDGYLGLPTIVNGLLISDGSTTTGITSGIFGDSVTFDYGQLSNSFSFTGATMDVVGSGSSNKFTLGTFTYSNGFFHKLSYIDLTLTTHSSDASLDGHIFYGRIRLDANINIGTPEEGADYFTVQDASGVTLTSLGSVRVYDYNFCPIGDPSSPNCNTGSVDIIGHINSLDLDSFANPTGGAFINSSTTPPLASVPEPGMIWLFGSGLLGFLATNNHRKTR